MTREPSNTKRFNITVEVDIDRLTEAYTGGDSTLSTDLISMLEHELGWASASGVQVLTTHLLEEEN